MSDALHITDLEHDRPSVVGGASIYPFVQNLCIAFRVAGVATTITSLLVGSELPAKGFPVKLTRSPVEETTFIDSFGNSIAAPDSDI